MKDRAKMALGDVLAGRYRLDALIGEGGFGVVYRATQLPIGRAVALKVLLDELLAQSDGRARFRREAELAQRLSHPNTVRLYDFGETEEGIPFIAWELLEGQPLDTVLDAEGPLAAERVAWIAVQVLRSLMEAHQLGIVHRDLKPPNVFVCAFAGERNFVKVLDFGLAKNTLARAATRMTPEGSILGTPGYMSPEQVKGGAVTPASDLFSLGLMMAELMTGVRVFPGASPWDVITAQIEDRPTPLAPAVLASPLGPVIARATERSLERRYRSAAEMLQDLEVAAPDLGASRRAAPARTPISVVDLGSSPSSGRVRPPTSTGAPASTHPPTPILPVLASVALASPPYPPVPLASPPPARPSASFAPNAAPAPAGQGSRWKIVVAGVVGAILASGMLLGGLYAAGVLGGLARAASSTSPVVPAAGKASCRLDNKQLRARIEAAGYTVMLTNEVDTTTTWALTGMTGSYVQVNRAIDPKIASAAEQTALKLPGATSREGNCVIHVQLPQTAQAKALLVQITR